MYAVCFIQNSHSVSDHLILVAIGRAELFRNLYPLQCLRKPTNMHPPHLVAMETFPPMIGCFCFIDVIRLKATPLKLSKCKFP